MSALDFLSSGSSFQINDSIEESSMEFVEKWMNSDYMTQTEQIKSGGPLKEFVNEEINSAKLEGFNSKPQTGLNSMTNMSIQNENPP